MLQKNQNPLTKRYYYCYIHASKCKYQNVTPISVVECSPRSIYAIDYFTTLFNFGPLLVTLSIHNVIPIFNAAIIWGTHSVFGWELNRPYIIYIKCL